MSKIIIIGNSGAALECYNTIQAILSISSMRVLYSFKGFLSHRGYKGSLGSFSHLELGSDENYQIEKDDVFVLGIGDNKIRHEAYNDIKSKDGKFINLVHPTCILGENIRLGEGNVFARACSISNNVEIGNANYFNGNVVLGHDVCIADANFFASFSQVYGLAQIASFNHVAPSAIIMDRAKIGSDNKIAPAAVLYKGCRDNCLMAGNPAVKMTEIEA